MKKRALAAACAVIVGIAASAAFANPMSNLSRPAGLIQKISCDTHDDDKQARCMQACDDVWIKETQAYNANIDNAKVSKKECDTKCGCGDAKK